MDEQYVEGVRELMAAYNQSGDDAIYRTLYELCYMPNEEALRENYEKNAARYAAVYDAPILSAYGALPVLLFPVTNEYSVLFDKEARRFHMDGEDGLFALLHVLIFAEKEDIPHAAECFRRHCDVSKARVLEQELRAAIGARDFGAREQRAAEEYHGLCPQGELYELFRAETALSCADIESALHWGQAAYEKRKMSTEVCDFLYRAYRTAGQPARAVLFGALAGKRVEEDIPNDPAARAECLDALSLAHTDMQFAPLQMRASWTGSGIEERWKIALCDPLPRFSAYLPAYRTGIYNPYGLVHVKSYEIAQVNAVTDHPDYPFFNDTVFDVMKAEETQTYDIVTDDRPVLLPLAAKEDMQPVSFRTADVERTVTFGRGEFGFYRIEGAVTIRADAPFLVGAPIVLRHSPQRRKLVLRILADGFSWAGIRTEAAELVPHIVDFFARGVLFDHSFSTAEYTYPALASIEAGVYQHKTQIATPGTTFALAPSYVTISEQMKRLGYYCTNVQGDGEGIYSGATRGYDRLIVNRWILHAAEGVERVVRHLEAFDECDNFLFLHFSDTHPYNSNISVPAYATTHLPLAESLREEDVSASVFLKPNPLNRYINRVEIRAMDRQLGYLFDYLTSHYEEDEYIVLLYSDHGASIYARSPYLLSEEQTGAALMVRGAGVPQPGRVDELTSSVDIYKILGKLAGYSIDAPYLDGNLPEVFGGKRREYTVSNSIYPGQTYKICVRTEHHAFHLETEEFTRGDGTVSFERYQYHIHERNEAYREVFDDALARYFLAIVRAYTENFRR